MRVSISVVPQIVKTLFESLVDRGINFTFTGQGSNSFAFAVFEIRYFVNQTENLELHVDDTTLPILIHKDNLVSLWIK